MKDKRVNALKKSYTHIFNYYQIEILFLTKVGFILEESREKTERKIRKTLIFRGWFESKCQLNYLICVKNVFFKFAIKSKINTEKGMNNSYLSVKSLIAFFPIIQFLDKFVFAQIC